MRWLLTHPGPNFSVADVLNGWEEALRELGQDVRVYNLDDRLNFYEAAHLDTGAPAPEGGMVVKKALTHDEAIAMAARGVMDACYQWWPDVVLAISAFFLAPSLLELMRKRGHKIVLLHTESPYQDESQLVRASHANINLLNDPVNLRDYQRLGIPAYYMPHAYRPKLHHPGKLDYRLACDLSFVGTGYPSRIRFFSEMTTHPAMTSVQTLLAGNWMPLHDSDPDSPLLALLVHEIERCLDNEQAVDLYRSSKLGINVYRREAEDQHEGEGWALGPRELEMAATGLFYLRDPRPEGDELLPMLPTFTSPADAAEKVKWWLAHDELRSEVAAKARAAVADRTFENNARQLLNWLEGL